MSDRIRGRKLPASFFIAKAILICYGFYIFRKKQEETKIIKLRFKNARGRAPACRDLNCRVIPRASVCGDTDSPLVIGPWFDFVVLENDRTRTSWTEVVLIVKETRKGLVRKGDTYRFVLKREKVGGGSVLSIGAGQLPAFMEFFYDCFRWLFLGLVYEIETDGGVGEQILMAKIKESLMTRYEQPAPKKHAPVGPSAETAAGAEMTKKTEDAS